MSSTNFKIVDPVLGSGGALSTSTSFRLFGSLGQPSIGTSNAAASFSVNAGFLYFPFASSPVLSAAAGANQVSLSWSASTGVLGWVVSGYNIGQSTTSGGPYTYTEAGNVTSKAVTGLTAGTTYYFVVRAEDALGDSIATSSEASATPTAPTTTTTTTTTTTSSGGGGGGGGIATTPTKILLKGAAYPGAVVTVLKDGSVLRAVTVDTSGNWSIESEIGAALYTISIYAIDSQNRRSLTTSFTLQTMKETTTIVSGIVIAPTISADKSEVKVGNTIQFFGFSYPSSTVNVIINSDTQIADTAISAASGFWKYVLQSQLIGMGNHTTRSQTVTPDNLLSPFSESLAFQVGDRDVAFGTVQGTAGLAAGACRKNGDINGDGRVNLIDFSILLFFWNQRSPKNPCADINGDGVVNLFDFSIMLFWWTG